MRTGVPLGPLSIFPQSYGKGFLHGPFPYVRVRFGSLRTIAKVCAGEQTHQKS